MNASQRRVVRRKNQRKVDYFLNEIYPMLPIKPWIQEPIPFKMYTLKFHIRDDRHPKWELVEATIRGSDLLEAEDKRRVNYKPGSGYVQLHDLTAEEKCRTR